MDQEKKNFEKSEKKSFIRVFGFRRLRFVYCFEQKFDQFVVDETWIKNEIRRKNVKLIKHQKYNIFGQNWFEILKLLQFNILS